MKIKKGEYVIAKDHLNLSTGDTIRVACELMGFSQAELARRSGIAEPHISAIVNGKRLVGRIVAEKLSRALNISPSVILFAGEAPRDGADLSGIDTSLLEKAIQTVEDNKNENTRTQLEALGSAIEFIARAMLAVSRSKACGKRG